MYDEELDVICFYDQSHKVNISSSILYTSIPMFVKQLGKSIHFSVRIRHKRFTNMTNI
jgi:hypothetical protein